MKPGSVNEVKTAYEHQEYPKWVDGKLVKSREEEELSLPLQAFVEKYMAPIAAASDPEPDAVANEEKPKEATGEKPAPRLIKGSKAK